MELTKLTDKNIIRVGSLSYLLYDGFVSAFVFMSFANMYESVLYKDLTQMRSFRVEK